MCSVQLTTAAARQQQVRSLENERLRLQVENKKRELPSQPQVPSLRVQMMNANGQLVEQLVLSNLNPKP
jgi:hypothetical protein